MQMTPYWLIVKNIFSNLNPQKNSLPLHFKALQSGSPKKLLITDNEQTNIFNTLGQDKFSWSSVNRAIRLELSALRKVSQNKTTARKKKSVPFIKSKSKAQTILLSHKVYIIN